MTTLQILNIRDVKEYYKDEYIKLKETGEVIYFVEQQTGYGVKYFFSCPKCGASREKLYIYDYKYVYCRTCKKLSPYKPIQNYTKGGEVELTYRMRQLSIKYKVPLPLVFPFDFGNYLWDRPKYYRVKKWEEGLRKLQILENMRFQNIIYKNTYDADLINFIFNNCLYVYDLAYIRKWLINWHGVRERVKRWRNSLLEDD